MGPRHPWGGPFDSVSPIEGADQNVVSVETAVDNYVLTDSEADFLASE